MRFMDVIFPPIQLHLIQSSCIEFGCGLKVIDRFKREKHPYFLCEMEQNNE